MERTEIITNRKIVSAWDGSLEAQLIAIGTWMQSAGMDVSPPQHRPAVSHSAIIRQLVSLAYEDLKTGKSTLLTATDAHDDEIPF